MTKKEKEVTEEKMEKKAPKKELPSVQLDERVTMMLNNLVNAYATEQSPLEGVSKVVRVENAITDWKQVTKLIILQLDHQTDNAANVLFIELSAEELQDELRLGKWRDGESVQYETIPAFGASEKDIKFNLNIDQAFMTTKYNNGPFSMAMSRRGVYNKLLTSGVAYNMLVFRAHSVRDDNIIEELVALAEDASIAYGCTTAPIVIYDDISEKMKELTIQALMTGNYPKEKKKKKKNKKKK